METKSTGPEGGTVSSYIPGKFVVSLSTTQVHLGAQYALASSRSGKGLD